MPESGEKQVRMVTRGSLTRAIFSLALPAIGTHIFVLAMDIVDGIMLGRVSSNHLAAVTLGWAIIFFLTTFAAGLGIGTVAMVSRASGEKKFAMAAHIGGQAVYMGIAAAMITGIAGVALSPMLLRMLGAADVVLVIGTSYLRILFGGIFGLFTMFICGAIFQGAGNTITPMFITGGALILNIILAPLLIFGLLGFPRLEASGAAIATIGTRVLGSAAMIYILIRGRHGARIVFRSWKPDLKIMKRVFVVGFPGSLQMFVRGTASLLVTKIAALIGPVAIAVLGGGGRLFGLFLFPGFAFGGAAATIVGQNLGNRNPERAERGALLASFHYFILLLSASIPVFVFARDLSRVFNTEPEFVLMCTQFLRYMSVGALALSPGLVLSRALQGAGETVWPMIATAIALFGVQLPLAYYLSTMTSMEAEGIWLANQIGILANAVLTMVIFFRGKWKTKRV